MSHNVVAQYFDGTVRKSWKCDLLEHAGGSFVFLGVFECEVEHPQLGLIRKGTISYEYYWLDRWYNVFRFHEPDMSFRNFYCNINMPPTLEGSTLRYVDLDLDVMVAPSGDITVLDRDEFEANAKRFGYPDDVQRNALGALDDLLTLIDRREFPFDRLEIPGY